MTIFANVLPLGHDTTLLFLSQLTLLLGVARFLGDLAKRFDQPAVVGELLAGLLLGPSLFGLVAPTWYAAVFPDDQILSYLLSSFSLFCVLILLIVTGLEIDLALIFQKIRSAALISISGLTVTSFLAILATLYFPDELVPGADKRIVFSIFVAINLSISAIPVIAKTLKDLKYIRRDLGQLVLATAMIDDSTGWILLAVASGLAIKGSITALDVGVKLLVSLSVMGLALTIGKHWVNRFLSGMDNRFPGNTSQLGAIICLALAFSVITQGLGLESMLGAFLAGILIGQSPRLKNQVAHSLELFSSSFCAPIYFATAGVKVNLPHLFTPKLLVLTAAIIMVATLGKYIGCYSGGRLAGLGHWQGLTLASGMNPRGAMGVIVAYVGFSIGIFNQDVYSVMIAMALITSLIAPILLRKTFSRVEITPEEKQRIANDARRSQSFLTSVNRVLLPSRGGYNAEVAAHLLGHFSHHHPVSISALFTSTTSPTPPPKISEAIVAQLKRSQGPTPKLDYQVSPDIALNIIRQAEKGRYDLLVLGATRDRSLSPVLDKVLKKSPCPTLVVQARPPSQEYDHEISFSRILLPVVGTNYSLRATEVAAVMASSLHAIVHIIHVVPPLDSHSHGPHVHQLAMDFAQNIVDHHADIARNLGASVDTEVIESDSPSTAIIKTAEGGYDLIFIATGIRPVGGQNFMGHQAEKILHGAPCSVAVLSS